MSSATGSPSAEGDRAPERPADEPERDEPPDAGDSPSVCVICGSDVVVWRRCKLICGHCGSILMSCGDL